LYVLENKLAQTKFTIIGMSSVMNFTQRF